MDLYAILFISSMLLLCVGWAVGYSVIERRKEKTETVDTPADLEPAPTLPDVPRKYLTVVTTIWGLPNIGEVQTVLTVEQMYTTLREYFGDATVPEVWHVTHFMREYILHVQYSHIDSPEGWFPAAGNTVKRARGILRVGWDDSDEFASSCAFAVAAAIATCAKGVVFTEDDLAGDTPMDCIEAMQESKSKLAWVIEQTMSRKRDELDVEAFSRFLIDKMIADHDQAIKRNDLLNKE